MAVTKFDLSPDFLNNQILNMVLQLLGTEPGVVQGKIFLDTGQQAVKVSLDGTTWDRLATISDLASSGVNMEMVMDYLGPTGLVEGQNITITYDDTGDGTITIGVDTATLDAATVGGQTPANLRDRATHTGTQPSSTISDFAAAVNALAQAKIDALVDAAPGTLDTLNELAAALGDDPNFVTTITNALGQRAQTFSQTYGDGALQAFTITHNLNTLDVPVTVREVSTGNWIVVPWTATGANSISITHTTVPASGQYRVTVIGRSGSA